MKSIAFFVALLAAPLATFAAPPKTPEAFLAAVKAAYEAKDPGQLEALTWPRDLDDKDRLEMDRLNAPILTAVRSKVQSIELSPLPRNLEEPYVSFGKLYKPNIPGVGIVKISFKSVPHGLPGLSVSYAIADGCYYLVGTKTVELAWKGPPDENINLWVNGPGQDKVHTSIKYNTSGVDLQAFDAGSSWNAPAQSIKEVTVTSDDDSVDVTLSIRKKGTVIYESAPLKGKGTLHYPPAK